MIIDSKKYNGPCSCGRTHQMATKFAVIEPGCLANFDHWFTQAGLSGKRAAIYDQNTYNAKNLIRPRADQEIILDPTNLHANEKATAAVLSQLEPDVEVLIAVGSGTIHDTTRYSAKERGIPFVACPTAASVDGFCSTVSAMTWGGFKKTLPGVAPIFVLADLDVIKEAPAALALSGVGDVLGKYTALADWKIAHALTGEFLCPEIEALTREAVGEVYASCRSIGAKDPAAFERLMRGLLLSGLAMQMMGNSRPASGAEHHISHIIEMEPEPLGLHSSALHGEKVGVGTALVSGAYHRLAEIEDIAPYTREYPPITRELILESYGERLCDSIAEENRADCMAGVTPARLAEHWGEIREIIREIPTREELEKLYREIGAKTTLEDIEVDSALLPRLLDYAPLVRNRMTLLRIGRMITAAPEQAPKA